MRRTRTFADWRAALEASGWRAHRRTAREWCGPCPKCGGTDRFHVGAGRKQPVVAGCRQCRADFGTLARAVFGSRNGGREGPTFSGGRFIDPETPAERAARNARDSPVAARGLQGRPNTPGGSETRSRGVSGRSGGIPADSGAPGSPLSTRNEVARPVGPPESARIRRARRLWERSEEIPADTRHPARRWAARRDLWPPGEPWPDSARWLAGSDGGSLVAAFAPLSDWWTGGPDPSGVQLVHVDADGRPRKDHGGRGTDKRAHGILSGAVCLIGDPIDTAGRVHVAEGIADGLAIAARCGGAAVVTGGAGGFPRLANPLAALSLPVTLWPDGDEAGRRAASDLADALRRRVLPVHVAPIPDGEDPAGMAAPGNEWRQTE